MNRMEDTMNRVGMSKALEQALMKLQDIYTQRRLIPRRWIPGYVRLPRNRARTGRVLKVWCGTDDDDTPPAPKCL